MKNRLKYTINAKIDQTSPKIIENWIKKLIEERKKCRQLIKNHEIMFKKCKN